MNPRYLMIARTGLEGWTSLLERISLSADLRPAFSHDRLALFVAPGGRWLQLGDHGCIVGSLCHRHGPARPIEALDPDDLARIIDSRGGTLITSWWGGYVAAIGEPGSGRLLRDPSGSLPCYVVRGPGYTAIASDAQILVDAGLARVEIDWEALARHFLAAGVPTPETQLRGIEELMPGFAVDLGAATGQTSIWSPWDFVEDRAEGEEVAAERLGRVVTHCVRASAAGRGRLLLSISGGLDSSIVAAALKEAGTDLVCLTMYGEDRSGDERVYAREVAAHLGLCMLERGYSLDDIDIMAPLGAHLPRTGDRTHALSYERRHLAVAAEIDAAAFVTGNGGDSVFGYSQSAAPIADRFLSEGLHRGVLRSLRDVCRQTGCSAPEALLGAWRAIRKGRRYQVRTTPLFLHPDRLAALADWRIDHPWLDAPADALPGKAAHIASILRVQQCFEPHRSRYLPVINPLMSQPILETCLSIPSWQWRSGGRDRAMARRAFAGRLPPSILERRAKGGPDGFAARILDTRRAAIRERLLDGHLQRTRMIDRPALEAALRQEAPVLGEQRVRIFEFLATEAWLDAWLARAGPGGAP